MEPSRPIPGRTLAPWPIVSPSSFRSPPPPHGQTANRWASRARRTVLWDGVRAALTRPAIVAAQGSGVFLIVAIQHFHASGPAKALLASATFIGMLIAPALVTVIAARGVHVRSALAWLALLSGAALALAGLSNSLWGFLLGVLLGAPLLQAVQPLVTSVWQAHVPNRFRGRLFGLVSSAAALTGIVTGLAIAAYLGDDASRYRPAVLGLALAVALGGVAALRLPRSHLQRSVRNPLRLLSLLLEHREFGYLSLAWMLLGFGNLSTVPLRVEHVAAPESGNAYSAALVLVLTTVIPQAAMLVSTLIWGRLFDRMNFLVLRISLNLVFMSSIILFFTSHLWLQVAGSVLFGVGLGGGAIQWNLWVTRYAPGRRTADYMAVHTFLTGTRGILAPFLAYALLERITLVETTRFGLVLLGTATVMVALLLLRDLRNRPASARE